MNRRQAHAAAAPETKKEEEEEEECDSQGRDEGEKGGTKKRIKLRSRGERKKPHQSKIRMK